MAAHFKVYHFQNVSGKSVWEENWGSFRGRREEKWGSFWGRFGDHSGVGIILEALQVTGFNFLDAQITKLSYP